MQNQIIINGQSASGEALEWLMRQDLNYLQQFISTSVLCCIISQGQGYNTVPIAPEAENIHVLQNFLHYLQELKESRTEA